MVIKEVMRKAYFAPSKGRHYLTKNAALKAEAKAIIEHRYPTEKSDRDETGRITYPGWYWQDQIPRADVLLRRVIRLLKNK